MSHSCAQGPLSSLMRYMIYVMCSYLSPLWYSTNIKLTIYNRCCVLPCSKSTACLSLPFPSETRLSQDFALKMQRRLLVAVAGVQIVDMFPYGNDAPVRIWDRIRFSEGLWRLWHRNGNRFRHHHLKKSLFWTQNAHG